jgi:hypothetical protein
MSQVPSFHEAVDKFFSIGVTVVFIIALIFVMAAMAFLVILCLPFSLGSLVTPFIVDLIAEVLTRILDSRVATICLWFFGSLLIVWIVGIIWIFMF